MLIVIQEYHIISHVFDCLACFLTKLLSIILTACKFHSQLFFQILFWYCLLTSICDISDFH